jgi:hypothetical protein
MFRRMPSFEPQASGLQRGLLVGLLLLLMQTTH